MVDNAQKTEALKNEAIRKYQRHKTDTGSPEVQIAMITSRIESLSEHVKKHGQDLSSQRGMLALVSQRKQLLQYLKTENAEKYRATVSGLGLRK